MTMEQKLDLLIEDMQELKSDMREVKSDVTELKSDVMQLKSEVAMLKTDMEELKGVTQRLEGRVGSLETGFQGLQAQFGELKEEVREIHLHLENVTDVNITRVAEGHIDLWRTLTEAVRISERDELRDVRINVLEGDVRRIKEKLQMCTV